MGFTTLVMAVGFAVLLMSECPAAIQGQEKGKPDISLEETRSILPSPPRNVRAKRDGKKKVVLSWEPSPLENVVSYNIYRKQGNGAFVKIGTAKSSPFVDDNAPLGTPYYAVTCVNGYESESPLSKSVETSGK
jgi:fibronectin type 3 domain-containing protein